MAAAAILKKISNGHISATGRPIDFMFGYRVGFSGTADLMAIYSIRINSRWRPPPAWIISNGHISATAHDLLKLYSAHRAVIFAIAQLSCYFKRKLRALTNWWRSDIWLSGWRHCLLRCSVPRFWFSRRWRMATLSCVALLITTSQRISIDVALHSMLNHSAAADNIRSLPLYHSPALLSSSGDNLTTTAADATPHSTACFNASSVDIFTTKIFEYQVFKLVVVYYSVTLFSQFLQTFRSLPSACIRLWFVILSLVDDNLTILCAKFINK